MDFNNVTTIINSRFLGHVPEVGPDPKEKVRGVGGVVEGGSMAQVGMEQFLQRAPKDIKPHRLSGRSPTTQGFWDHWDHPHLQGRWEAGGAVTARGSEQLRDSMTTPPLPRKVYTTSSVPSFVSL